MQAQVLINRPSFLAPAVEAWPIPSASRTPAVTTVDGSVDLLGAITFFARNAEVYGESEPTEYLYKVVKGAVRTYKVLSDGRRQIFAFYQPGDFFGLEIGDAHMFSAEAI